MQLACPDSDCLTAIQLRISLLEADADVAMFLDGLDQAPVAHDDLPLFEDKSVMVRGFLQFDSDHHSGALLGEDGSCVYLPPGSWSQEVSLKIQSVFYIWLWMKIRLK